MGNTCASTHIAWDDDKSASEAISRAYTKLGYKRVKKAPLQNGKHVILTRKAGQSFVSLYDSTNAQLDNGELKDVALAVSKSLKTASVFTSLYDSDSYEFIVFAKGKQIDFLAIDIENYNGPLKQLDNKIRPAQWTKLFKRDISNETIKQTISKHTSFADDIVSKLSALIGLTNFQSLKQYIDIKNETDSIVDQFYFEKKEITQPVVAEGQISLCNYFDPDNSRKLLVYPASWPMPVNKESTLTWLIISQGSGFSGGNANISISGPEGLSITNTNIKGFKFHHGQVVGDLETFPQCKNQEELDALVAGKQFTHPYIEVDHSNANSYIAKFPSLIIPSMTPQRTTEIAIIFQLKAIASAEGEWEINLHFNPGSQIEYSFSLPSARIAALNQKWLPIISSLNPKTTYDTSNILDESQSGYIQGRAAVMLHELKYKQSRVPEQRELDHFAIAANTIILKYDGQGTLDICQKYVEDWLTSIAEKREGQIKILAEKQMTESAYVGKTKKDLPISSFLQDKNWTKLFDYKNNYQTVLATIFPENAEYSIAGISMQCTMLEIDPRRQEQEQQNIIKTLAKMRGRNFENIPHGSTVHLSNWVINHTACYEFMGTSISALQEQLDNFVTAYPSIQAWHSQSTWRPIFGQAEDYNLTIYEDISVLNFFRGILGTDNGLQGSVMSLQWCNNVLRMVSPHMWVCSDLFEQIDVPLLDKVAETTKINGSYKITLRPNYLLDDLELALLPILPVESTRVKPST